MDENKIDFLYPSSSNVSPQNSFTPPVSIVSHELGLTSFTTQRPQVTPISQIYPSRKIKHSFRKRASSGSMPYYIPFRHRQRTKSESQDNNQGLSNQPLATMEYENTMEIQYTAAQQLVNNSNPQYNKIKAVQLKKSKSLESLNTITKDNKDVQKEHNFSTMEFFDLNTRIQKLNLLK
ncbi:hypothetical protein ACKWTF_007217 [Chironomus riparius]